VPTIVAHGWGAKASKLARAKVKAQIQELNAGAKTVKEVGWVNISTRAVFGIHILDRVSSLEDVLLDFNINAHRRAMLVSNHVILEQSDDSEVTL